MNVVTYSGVGLADLDGLVEIRLVAMKESLERVGRFDPVRARARLASNFDPDVTWSIDFEGDRVGFYVFRRDELGFSLDHLYIRPEHQGKGIGSQVIARLIREAGGEQIAVGALRDSDSNRFYMRHGFVKTGEDEFDIYYRYVTVK